MKEVDVGNYTVRYGKQEGLDQYDAAVVRDEGGLINTNVNGPIADHDKKWVAIGKAVSEYKGNNETE